MVWIARIGSCGSARRSAARTAPTTAAGFAVVRITSATPSSGTRCQYG